MFGSTQKIIASKARTSRMSFIHGHINFRQAHNVIPLWEGTTDKFFESDSESFVATAIPKAFLFRSIKIDQTVV